MDHPAASIAAPTFTPPASMSAATRSWLRWRGSTTRPDAGAGTARCGDALPPNVTVLPQRVRYHATWAEPVASYEAKPAEPGKVLAFASPPREPMP